MLKKTALALTASSALAGCAAPQMAQPAPPQAIVRIFELDIHAENLDAFNELGRHNITQSVNGEAGVLAMYALADKENPSKIYVVEAYADEAAYQAHRHSPHFQRWLNGAQNMIAARKVIETVPVVFGSKAVRAE